MGQNYPLNKRRGGGAWQWMLIGFVPGFLCAAALAIVAIAMNLVPSFSEPQVVEVTREIQVGIVVTATPDPLATDAVRIVTTTPEPTTEASEGSIAFPTETPQVENTAAVVSTLESQTVPTTGAAVVQPTTETNVSSAGGFTIPAELASNVSPLVPVAGGNFLMGTNNTELFAAAQECVNRDGGQCDPNSGLDSIPAVSVTVDDFSMETTEVSFGQYADFLNYLKSIGLSHTSGCFSSICIQTANERPDVAVISYDGANYSIPVRLENLRNHPVYGVTWFGAQAYCQAIGRRLPTEAEWEYAARAGGQNIPFPWGANWANSFANVRIPAIQTSGFSTVEVNSNIQGLNSLGLYHMAGNVAEWTNDWYNETYYQTLSSQAQASPDGAVLNPQGPAGGTQRAVRGGSFDTPPFFARTYHRQNVFPSPESSTADFPLWIGFRCVQNGLADNSAPASSGAGTSPLATIPVSGSGNTDAQPTVPSSPEESETDSDAARG